MKSKIIKMSDYAARILTSDAKPSFHSGYEKAINLSFNGQLLTLQPKTSSLSPLSLITDLSTNELSSLLSEPSPQLSLSKNTIFLDVHKITFANAKIFYAELFPLDHERCLFLRQILENTIITAPPQGFVLIFQPTPNLNLMLKTARKHIHATSNSLKTRNFQDAVSHLISLIGLGIGLTPSGDDFLCGFLCGLIFMNLWDTPFSCYLRQQIQCNLSRTNEISSAFLSCALHRQFGTAVHMLSDHPKMSHILSEFLAIGHSSGLDTLCGIYFAFQIFL
ncbi:DUF2877 domain-containing protein [Anaerostipes sp. MSJ-23]|uniref:DUF2877 domain-containing protein n=1 Tax=unclassified Anaerostipes TaxID=2635253 RepID=UPI001C112D24|nr:DUF2877 domain-containing protein [Anaerostipes sp. MSJ-23]MBU5459175.1 DUF2877 domain-containing protein [Anaerostipes sp. MSJ-23]